MPRCSAFRHVSELALEQLRHNRETLLDVLSTMRHDPLVEWSKRNLQEDTSGAKDSEEVRERAGDPRPRPCGPPP